MEIITSKIITLLVGTLSGFILGMWAVKTKKEEMAIMGAAFYFLFIIGFLIGLNHVN